MSGIVLSASVRQNLLSLQYTASLLATTQNDLATGNKVNSALDNPTEFFTAQSLNNRASDIGNLLDGIGNGVQVLQAANTGLTSLQTWSRAPSRSRARRCRPRSATTRNQAFHSAVINGATANNLLGSSSTRSCPAPCSSTTTYTSSTVAITGATRLSRAGLLDLNDLAQHHHR